MNMRTLASLTAFLATALAVAAVEAWQTIDLRAFTNYSIFEHRKPEWFLPRGEQVLDGVPFRVDGVIQLAGVGWIPELKVAPKSVKGIPVGGTFHQLHLLAAIVGSEPESNTVARVRLEYQSGSNAVIELKYGDHFRNWVVPLHKSESPLRDTNHAAVAWIAQSSDDAAEDRYTRLFHLTFENPHPAEVVRSLTLESSATNSGPFVAGLTVASANAPRLTNTLPLPSNPFPDLRKRKGEPAELTGVVRTWSGQPLTNATVRAVAERGFNSQEWRSGKLSASASVIATTDASGRFRLPPLPDDKLYHLVATAPGEGAFLFPGADPRSEPVEIRLQRTPANHDFRVRVRVVDEAGQPIAGALVEREGVRTGHGTSWGGDQGLPGYNVSDANGEFSFSRAERFTALQMTITAPGLAPNKCWADVTNTLTTITLDAGATMRGRVVKDGQALTNLTMGVSGVDRNSEVFVGHFSTKTDSNGVFEFQHLPARKSFWLFGTMDSVKPYGAIRPRQIVSAAVGETNEIDDLEVGPGLRLAGRVEARRGEKLPDDLRLTLGVEHWDSQSVKLDTNGGFEFTGVSSGLVEINLSQSKWRLSAVNRSFDNWGNHQLVGLLQQDKDDLLVVIEPGAREYNYESSQGQLPQADQARSRPLFGAEPSGPYPITLAGQVVDGSTGKPVRKFTLVPGRKPPGMAMALPAKPLLQRLTGAFQKPPTPWNELPWWDNQRKDTFTNGVFSVDFMPLTSTPMFRIEADGYEPFISEPMAANTTNLVIRLSSGSGPSGVVFLPDGKPAAGANVWFAVAREQASLSGPVLHGYGNKASTQTTGADGRFNFPARLDGRKIFASHTDGWAIADVSSGGNNLKIQLAAWGVVTGTLVSSNGAPMPGVTLHLNHPYDWNNGDPIINVQGNTLTDAKGKFVFTNAAPGRLDLNREIPMGGGGWTYRLQTWFICQPGITNDLGKVTYDTPPPPPFSEKMKKALGL